MLFSRNKIRLRFAPSPTGFLHLGGLRSALFGYLIAKSQGGKFILRIEDTDQKREVTGAAESLIKILDWAGLKFDEGPSIGGKYGPYTQSERLSIYQEHAERLLQTGKVYRCFCSAERLEEMRAEQTARKEAPRYDRLCRNLDPIEAKRRAETEPFVIRQKMPLEGTISVHDELLGDIKFPAKDLDDQVLIKSNGVPTYQFANVVDDHLMKISHVTRGYEWLPSYPRNILLYQDFGWTPPKFIHLPLILNKEGGKLSKRQGDVFVEQYRDKGYLPAALINFCVLMGWHPKDNQEVFSLDELKKVFSVSGMGTSPAIFDEDKLDYFNGHYLRLKTTEELTELARPYLEQAGNEIKPEQLNKFISLARDRMKKLSDVVELTGFLFSLPPYEESLLVWKTSDLMSAKNNLREISGELEKIKDQDWKQEYLEKTLIAWLKENNKKNGDYLWPLRVALTGLKNSPGPFEVAAALGQEESFKRIKKAINQ